jgi:phosphatidylinositol alpha 1,6-mannosyltransferase
VEIRKELEQIGTKNFRFVIVGHGGDEAWLREHLRGAEFTGVLRGEALATAYANMDLFVFPSHTDTFGNVVLEALASGVPAIVTPDGGPRTIIADSQTGRDGKIGRIVPDDRFASAIAELINDPGRLAQMRKAAREYALTASWDSVFEGIYAAYRELSPVASRSSTAD